MISKATISTAVVALVLGLATNAATDELDLQDNIPTPKEGRYHGKLPIEGVLEQFIAEQEANERKALNDAAIADGRTSIGRLSELKADTLVLINGPVFERLTAKFGQALNCLYPFFDNVPVLIYMRLSAVAFPLLFFATLHYRNRN